MPFESDTTFMSRWPLWAQVLPWPMDLPQMSPRCSPDATQMSPRCLPDASRPSPDASRCLQIPPDASRSPQMPQDLPRCLPDASLMPPRCFQDALHKEF